MKKGEKFNYLFVAVLILLVFISYKIISPYLVAIISAFILAYLIKPVYVLLNKKFNKTVSAFISIFLLILVLAIPVYFGIKNLSLELYGLISSTSLDSFLVKISSLSILSNFDLVSFSDKILSFLSSFISSILVYLPSLVLNIVVTFLGTFYILINWDKLSTHLEKFLPFKNKNDKIKEIKKKTDSLIYGLLFVGIIEGIVALIGFYISGVNSYVFASALIFLSALIPGVGPALIWVPLVIYNLFLGNFATVIGVLITGCVISYGIDTFFSIKFLGSRSKINPFVMFIGILGGISLFGIFGFVIGPLILIYTLELLEEFFD